MKSYLRLYPISLITIGCCFIVFACWLVIGKSRLETDLLAMLPATEKHPVAEKALEQMSGHLAKRIVFGVSSNDPKKASKAAEILNTFIKQASIAPTQKNINKQALFLNIVGQAPEQNVTPVFDFYSNHRAHLVDGSQLEKLSTPDKIQQYLLERANMPGLGMGGSNFAQDPFLWIPAFIGKTPFANQKIMIEDGWLTAHTDQQTMRLVIAELNGSAYDHLIQDSVHQTITNIQNALSQHQIDVQFIAIGSVRFAYEARTSTQKDMEIIGWFSIAGILILLLLAFRAISPIILGVFSIAVGTAGGTIAVILIDGKLHLLTLVFGASLLGETIDYAIQYFAVRLSLGKQWNAKQGIKLVRPALLIALGTSLLGYLALGLTSFPGLRQIGIFSMAGLACAFLCVCTLLPAILTKASTAKTHESKLITYLTQYWSKPCKTRIHALLITLIIVSLCTIGLYKLRSNDDIKQLYQLPKHLVAEENLLRQTTGWSNSGQFFLVEGNSIEQTLTREHELIQHLQQFKKTASNHQQTNDTQSISDILGVSRFVAPENLQKQRYDVLQQWIAHNQLERQLAIFGFDKKAQQTWLTLWQTKHPITITDWLAQDLSKPYRHLWMGQQKQGFASIVQPLGIQQTQHLINATKHLPGITFVDKAQSTSHYFSELRQSGSFGLLLILTMTLILLMLNYGRKKAFMLMMPTCLGLISVLGLCGWLDIPLSVFNLMSLLLVAGVGVNYAIFAQQKITDRAILMGVWVSAMTSLLSFGSLGVSNLPALQGFGMTLSLGICLTLCYTPLCLQLFHGQANNTMQP